VLVGADVREVVIPPMDDPGVRLAVVRIRDDVEAPDFRLRDTVDYRSQVLDLNVVEGTRGGRIVLVDAADLTSLPFQIVWR
jgi:hypothetical protein